MPKLNRGYAYQYDNLNRLKAAIYQKTGVATNAYNESLTYDKNGNILSLNRNGTSETATAIDKLAYTYSNNQLLKVADTSNKTQGFVDGTNTDNDFTYDVNGNMTIDKNKGITLITYNHLNLPIKITFGTTGNIVYVYNATGQKLKKVVTQGTTVTTTDYLGGYQYVNNTLQFFPTAEGYVSLSGTTYSYTYQYKDHLGNIRLSYSDANNDKLITNNEIVEESNYYPFGLKQTGYNNVTNSLGNSSAQKYKYNGKELQDELGLNMYDYGARNYDPAIGRWMNIDPLAEKSRRFSPYVYALDNPIYYIDPDGMEAESGPQRWTNSSETRPDDWIQWKSSDGENHITYDSSITTKEQAEKKGYTNVTKVFANGIAHNSDYTDVAEFSADGHYVINGGEKLDVDDTSSTMTTGNTFISENKGIVDAIGDFLPGALQIGGDRITKGAGLVALTGAEPIAAFLGTIGGILSTLGATGEVINNTAEGFSSGDFKLGKTLRTIGSEVLSKKLNTSGNDFGQTGEIWNDILINETNNQIDKLK